MIKNINSFNESEFQALVQAAYFNYFMERNFQFKIPSLREERDLGYDFYIKGGVVPIYIQFKKSKIFSNNSSAKIFIDRKKIQKFEDTKGVYYFNIHIDKKSRSYVQHGKLIELNDEYRKRGNDRNCAFYVAPCFVDKNQLYDSFLTWISYKSILPSENGDKYKVYDVKECRDFKIRANSVELERIIFIVPHKGIDDQERHWYCFNEKRETSFHSDIEYVSNDNISSFIEILQSLKNKWKPVSFEDILKVHLNVILNSGHTSNEELLRKIEYLSELNRQEDKTKLLNLTSAYLKKEWNIDAYITLRNDI